MYKVDNRLNEQEYKGLHIEKLGKASDAGIMVVFLEKDADFPKHASPTDAHLIVLQGHISFHINNELFELKTHQHFRFPKDELHWVEANEDSKFLIIR